MELVKSLAPAIKPSDADASRVRNLFCGDLHMHTFYSGGDPSPVGLALEAMHSYLDFAVISDHEIVQGARLARDLLGRYGFRYPLTVGQEVTMDWAHMNVYPVSEVGSCKLSPEDVVKAAHAQGAVIQWNHPGGPGADRAWDRTHLKTGIGDTEIDAWEHFPYHYADWKRAGALPVIVGSTDTHNGYLTVPWGMERTIIFAPTCEGGDLAAAIKRGNAVMLWPDGDQLLYGPDWLIARILAALTEGKTLKAATAERLRDALRSADPAGLIMASHPIPVFAGGP